MATFELLQDYTAEGMNITPYGSEIPIFHLSHDFYKGKTVESVDETETTIDVETQEGVFSDGSPFTGHCIFIIPKDILRLVDENIDVPPPPPTEFPLVEVHITGDVSIKPYTESTGESVNVDYQPVDYQPINKENNDGLKLGVFIILLIVGVIIWMFLANC